MGWDQEQRRLEEQRQQRQLEERRLEEQRRRRQQEERRLDEKRYQQQHYDQEYQSALDAEKQKRQDQDLKDQAKRAAKLQEILRNPSSYVDGVAPNAFPAGTPATAPVRPKTIFSYPTTEVQLHAWDVLYHPENRYLSIEVQPRIDRRLQVSIHCTDSSTVILTEDEWPHSWRQPRSSAGVAQPMEVRRSGQGLTLRWLAPNGTNPSEPPNDATSTAMVNLTASLAKTVWRTWRGRKH